MATSKTSSYHNMPHRSGTYMSNHGASAASEVTPDLHLKMSKKIAQLTKVIYALNTKNDEHESIVDALKKTHEDEMQHLIAETKNKVESFKTRLGVVDEQQQKIEALESLLSQERLHKEEALSEFETTKLQNEAKLAQLKEEYSDKILSISRDMLSTKKDFDDRLKEFQAMRRKLEEDRDKMVDELTSKHHEELDQLMKAHRVRYDEIVREKQKMEDEFAEREAKIKAQANSTSSLALEEKIKLEKEYQEKAEKLKSFYEKELDALRAVEAQSKEQNSKSLEEREKQLKLEWNRQERALKDRISELLNRQSESEHEISVLQDRISELQNLTDDKSIDSEKLSQLLEQSKQETSTALSEVRELKNDVMIYKKRCEEKGAEIARQSTVIGKLEAAKLSQETNNRTLKSTINELNNKVSKLETDYEELEHQYKSHFMETGDHIHSLKEEIKKISDEKNDIEGKYLVELNNSKESASERENNLRKELERTILKLNTEHKSELQKLQEELQNKLTRLQQELEDKSQKEKDIIIKEKTLVICDLENQCNELKKKLESVENESKRLYSIVEESEKGLGSATSNLDSLRHELEKTAGQLDSTKKELANANNMSASLQSQLEKLKKEYEQSKVEAQKNLQTSLQSLTKQLDQKWTDKLSKECSQLRSELDEQHQRKTKAALEELTRIKQHEMEVMKTELNIKIETLRRTADDIAEEKESYITRTSALIKDLQDSLEKRKANASSVEQQLREDLEKQRVRFEEDAARLSVSHNNKMKEIKELHEEQLIKMKETGEQQLKDLEAKLLAKHQEDMAFNLQANKVAMDAVKSQAESAKKKEMEQLLAKHDEERETLRTELMRKQQDELQQLNKEFESQMMTLKLQLQRTNEIMTRQESEYQTKLDDISHEVELRDTQLKELDDELSQLRENVSRLEDELQLKGQEILAIRRETNSQIRKREEHLGRLHQKEVDSLSSEHLRETQGLVEEFNRAKELQNSKISALQLMLDEAEIRFQNRESRPEDIEMLDTLKRALAERELEMKKLLEEKRYFQMELLNRETNFNKVFNSSPQVGIINPLNSKTSVKKTVNKNSGILMSSSRLDPIPNMHLHEKRLNKSKPLPPTPPKDGQRRPIVY